MISRILKEIINQNKKGNLIAKRVNYKGLCGKNIIYIKNKSLETIQFQYCKLREILK